MTQQKTDYSYEGTADRLRDADATDRLKDAGDRAHEMAWDAARHARHYIEKAQDAARQFKPFIDDRSRSSP
jgi:hypothetical protein